MMHAFSAIASSLLWLLCSSMQLPDPSGAILHPFNQHGQRAEVFLFVSVDCPIANGYAPEIHRIVQKYKSQGFDFYLVYGDSTVKPSDVAKHVADYGFKCPALLDPGHNLVNLLHATRTPEAAVVDPHGQLLYRGRIDNWYADFGQYRSAATTHDLRDALDAVLAGKPVRVAVTKAIGCPI
jgi:hypothetical protein